MLRGIKEILVAAVLAVAYKVVLGRLRDFWELRCYVKSVAVGLRRRLMIRVYEKYLHEYGAYIPLSVEFAGTPCFPHGIYGVFISCGAKIGKDAVIFQQVTIGSNTLKDAGGSQGLSPIIGDNCYVGAGAKIIGGVTVGDNVRIGANCCVYKDVPSNSVCVSSPMRIIEKAGMDNAFYSKELDGRSLYFKDGEWHHGPEGKADGVN